MATVFRDFIDPKHGLQIIDNKGHSEVARIVTSFMRFHPYEQNVHSAAALTDGCLFHDHIMISPCRGLREN